MRSRIEHRDEDGGFSVDIFEDSGWKRVRFIPSDNYRFGRPMNRQERYGVKKQTTIWSPVKPVKGWRGFWK